MVAPEVVMLSVKPLDLIHTVDQTLHDWRYCERSTERPTDFTRDRKARAAGIISSILHLVGRATPTEWDEFRDRLWPFEAESTTNMKLSWAKVRQKIRPAAFTA